MNRHLMFFVLLFATHVVSAAGTSVTYTIDNKKYEGYYVSPSAKAPLVVLVHDWDGLTGYEVQRANMLAEKGYAVFAVDLFGKGVRPTEMNDKRQHTGELYKDREKMRRLMRGAIATAKEQGAQTSNAVAMGYCFGGAAVLELARAGDNFKGWATFHGGLATPEGQSYKDTKGKLLIMHGTADTAVPMTDFTQLATSLEDAGLAHEMVTYGGAPHAFTVFNTDRYRADADKKSWAAFTLFLDETLKQ